MQNTSKDFEAELRTIVNHPLRAFRIVDFGLWDAMYDNSEIMFTAVKVMGMGVKSLLKGALVILRGLKMLTVCLLCMMCHIFILAFYPGIKIYFILRVRRDLRRDHPEYIARE